MSDLSLVIRSSSPQNLGEERGLITVVETFTWEIPQDAPANGVGGAAAAALNTLRAATKNTQIGFKLS